MSATTSGQAAPVKETVTLPPAMAALQKWRNADQEDAIRLSRDDVIALIEEERAELAQARADAEAAVALAYETAAKEIRDAARVSPYHNGMTVVYQRGLSDGFEAAAQTVEFLAPPAGVAKLAELRAERDAAEEARDAFSKALSQPTEGAPSFVNVVTLDYHNAVAADLAASRAREAEDADLLLNAYKAILVLHRMCYKSGLTAGTDAANNIANQIVAAHPEMPVRASLRAAIASRPDGGA